MRDYFQLLGDRRPLKLEEVVYNTREPSGYEGIAYAMLKYAMMDWYHMIYNKRYPCGSPIIRNRMRNDIIRFMRSDLCDLITDYSEDILYQMLKDYREDNHIPYLRLKAMEKKEENNIKLTKGGKRRGRPRKQD